ncbi:hypothetical protein C8R46DRAFT_268675 [Mycena filopes]|nr:hypothetical protein C8R46DRAFT_268675 [Mycena filopes]
MPGICVVAIVAGISNFLVAFWDFSNLPQPSPSADSSDLNTTSHFRSTTFRVSTTSVILSPHSKHRTTANALNMSALWPLLASVERRACHHGASRKIQNASKAKRPWIRN